LNPDRAKEFLSKVADDDTARVIWTEHARQRTRDRDITTSQVMRCIRHGKITEGPAPEVKGGWRMTLDVLAAGDPIRAVVVLTHHYNNDSIIVVTTHELR
jgi:hypothetical protein